MPGRSYESGIKFECLQNSIDERRKIFANASSDINQSINQSINKPALFIHGRN